MATKKVNCEIANTYKPATVVTSRENKSQKSKAQPTTNLTEVPHNLFDILPFRDCDLSNKEEKKLFARIPYLLETYTIKFAVAWKRQASIPAPPQAKSWSMYYAGKTKRALLLFKKRLSTGWTASVVKKQSMSDKP